MRVTVVEETVTVAVTVIVYAPSGVPGSAIAGSLAPPPPHPAAIAASARKSAPARTDRTTLVLFFSAREAAIRIAIAPKIATSMSESGVPPGCRERGM